MSYLPYKNILLAILSGILLAISFPTYGFPYFLFIAFVPLLVLEHEMQVNQVKNAGWKTFFYSYISFFIWNAIVYHWLLFVAVNKFGAYVLPLVFNSLFMTIVFILYHKVKKISGTYYGLVFLVCIWISFEFLHLNWSANWPWLNLGNAFAGFHETIQWYEFTGTFGGTLWVLVVNIFIFIYWKYWLVTRQKKHLEKIVLIAGSLIIIPTFISLFMYYSNIEKSEGKIEVVLIQPQVDPYTEKYNRTSEDLVREILDLSQTQISQNTDFVLGPETAFPGSGSINFNHKDEDDYLLVIKDFYKLYPKLSFVSGVEFEETFTTNDGKNPALFKIGKMPYWIAHYNSTLQLQAQDSLQYYHKSKLVPGVEGMPFTSLLKPILNLIMLDFGGTTHSLGTSSEAKIFTNSYNKAKVAPTICYESVFGEKTAEFSQKGANVLFISTNDSWWQNSQGHKQLLAFSKLRAIENRRDIARSANSGVSCFINQRGDILASLPYNTQGALKGNVNLNNERTAYSKYGDYIARIAMFLFGILAMYTVVEAYKKRKTKVKLPIIK